MLCQAADVSTVRTWFVFLSVDHIETLTAPAFLFLGDPMIQKALKASFLSFAAVTLITTAGCGSSDTANASVVDAMQHAESARVGSVAPDFTLVDLDGKVHTLSDYTSQGKIVVLEWFNPGCPYVKKHYQDADRRTMNELAADYAGEGVIWLAINSGAPGKQGHGFEMNSNAQSNWDMDRPILSDESGNVGRLYQAESTPEMYVIDGEGILRYHGAIDNDNSPRTIGNVNYVRNAIDAIMSDSTVEVPKTRAYGCSVKY